MRKTLVSLTAFATLSLTCALAQAADTTNHAASANGVSNSDPSSIGGASAHKSDSRMMSPDKSQASTKSDAMSMSDDSILSRLHVTNMNEIKAGEMALQKATSPAVKQFAQTLVRDHRSADQQTMDMAKSMNRDLSQIRPAGLDDSRIKDQASDMARLNGLSGADFDREFMKSMQKGHEEAVDFATQARDSTQTASLRGFLDNLLPKLRHHREMAMKFNQQRNGNA
jgi:putative membrane protein